MLPSAVKTGATPCSRPCPSALYFVAYSCKHQIIFLTHVQFRRDSGAIYPLTRNGSDYTAFKVKAWSKATSTATSNPTSKRAAAHQPALTKRDAEFTVETTTVIGDDSSSSSSSSSTATAGAPQHCDLLFAISCTGADCSHMGMWISGSFEWGRVGNVQTIASPSASASAPAAAAAGSGSDTDTDPHEEAVMSALTFEPAGFAAVTAYPATSSTIVPAPASLEGSAPVIVVAFGERDADDADDAAGGDGGAARSSMRTVGASTGL